MNKEQLTAHAQGLQIQVPEGATNTQISDLIKIAEHPNLKQHLKESYDVFDAQKELTEKAEKERDAETEKLGAANELIAELEEKLAQANATPEVAKAKTYKNDSGEFEITVGSFRFKGEKHTAEEAIDNDELMEALISANFIHLKKH